MKAKQNNVEILKRFRRFEFHYSCREMVNVFREEWMGLVSYLRAHEIVKALVDHCESHLASREIASPLWLRRLDLKSFIKNYISAYSVTVSVVRMGDGSALLSVIFWYSYPRWDRPSYWLEFTIKQWGHISKVCEKSISNTVSQIEIARKKGVLP
jgi:hypothetical protein